MSMFRNMMVKCPACAAPVQFKVVISVNADRRADLRAAIIAGSFQRQECGQCGAAFRLDPEMTYIDVRRGQWVAAYPMAKLGQWKELEDQARASFDQAYGPSAPPAAQELGADMKPRITFGWGAMREKIMAVEHQLDDVTLELVKLAIMRTSGSLSLSSETELRFIAIDGDQLVLAWIRGATGQVVEGLKVPRQLYDDILASPEGWQALRDQLSAGLFVDTNRLMVPAAAA